MPNHKLCIEHLLWAPGCNLRAVTFSTTDSTPGPDGRCGLRGAGLNETITLVIYLFLGVIRQYLASISHIIKFLHSTES